MAELDRLKQAEQLSMTADLRTAHYKAQDHHQASLSCSAAEMEERKKDRRPHRRQQD